MSDSARFSLKGWNLWEWFKGNWKTIKEMGKVVIPGFLSWTATQSPALTVPLTIFGKALLDVLEYYVKKY